MVTRLMGLMCAFLMGNSLLCASDFVIPPQPPAADMEPTPQWKSDVPVPSAPRKAIPVPSSRSEESWGVISPVPQSAPAVSPPPVESFPSTQAATWPQPYVGPSSDQPTFQSWNQPTSTAYPVGSSVVPSGPPSAFQGPGGVHIRYPFYSYRRPWYTPGQASFNMTIIW